MKQCTKCQVVLTDNNSYFRVRNGKKCAYSYCMNCAKQAVFQRGRELKQKAIEYKGGKCNHCGYDKCPAALEFHHIDPTTKDFTLSHKHLRSFESVKPELDKCLLLCSNCHKELHYKWDH